LTLGLSGLAACSAGTEAGPPPRAENEHRVTGLVVGVSGDTVSVAHDEIPGYMAAMTMPFTLANPAEGASFAPGDRVRFDLRVGPAKTSATNFTKIGRDTVILGGPSSPPVRRIRTGEALPAINLIDQNGAGFSTRHLAAHPTVMTFIYTRCPVPEFCPRVTGYFKQIQRSLVAAPALPDVRLLSVSLDPTFDTPPVLRAYGQAMGADFSRWTFATGEAAEITALSQALAVHSERSSTVLDHTLATALIDREGILREIWRGNQWTVAEVMSALKR
jgi:protein SCO1/2